MKAIIHFDGACKGNPGGPVCGAAVIQLDRETIETGIYNPHGTNNTAEYKGLIAGLKKCLELGVKEVEVYGDSNLVVSQVNLVWKVRTPELKPFQAQARELITKFESWTLTWIPREQNKQADKLAGTKLKEYINGKKE